MLVFKKKDLQQYIFQCVYVCYSLAKPSMPDTVFWNLQQYMCIFAIVKYMSNIGGMSDGVPKNDFSTY